jgi:hypothetical protein
MPFLAKDNRGCDTVRVPHRKGTCLVVTVAPRRPRIEFRADDPTLTPNGGLALVAETCRVLDVIDTIERHVEQGLDEDDVAGPASLPDDLVVAADLGFGAQLP